MSEGIKMKKMNDYPKIEINPKNAIALKCGECCCFDWIAVNDCPNFLCALYTARPKGRKDNLKAQFWDDEKLEIIARPVIKKRTGREMSPDEKKAVALRLKKAREADS